MKVDDIQKLKKDIVLKAQLKGQDFTFHSTWGLFSPREIDEGSRLLIEEIDVKSDDLTLDIGCGYGAIGIPIAKLSPNGKVHMVDKDYVAVEYAKKNTEINKVSKNTEIYLSNAFSNVPNIEFDNIVSNLPAKAGKELFYIILEDAKNHLKKNGKFYVVTISGLKEFIKRNFESTFGNYKKLKQGKNYTVAMAIKK